MFKFFQKTLSKLTNFFITNSVRTREITETREIGDHENRETKHEKLIMESFHCPYCQSTKFVKRGFRQKKREKIQLFKCLTCNKTFTSYSTRGKHYPMEIVLDAISIYNLGYSLEKSCQLVKERSGTMIPPSSLTDWLSETTDLCRFSRMREFALKKFAPKDMVIHATLAHRQLYRYRFHRAKCELIIKEDFKHHRFGTLQEFLEMVPAECPHQYFQEGLRASEAPLAFSKKQMIVRAKQNYANKLCTFVLQSVKERKLRHEALQKFMLANDSVTVATEVPVYITRDDIEHMKTQLGFQIFSQEIPNPISQIPNKSKIQNSNGQNIQRPAADIDRDLSAKSLPKADATIAEADIAEIVNLPKLITGHIDILQIRNGQIHILDYKPRAEKERPIEQLTLYAMALSRLTGLRLFEFKCAWFDEKDYFEFYPLHVLHKPRKTQRRRKVYTMEGIYKINQDENKINNFRPVVAN